MSIEEAINAANREWELWNRHTFDLRPGAPKPQKIPKSDTDKDSARVEHILSTYCPAAKSTTTAVKIMGDKYAWSGVAISYFFEKAKFKRWSKGTGEGFPFSAGHRKWIKLAIKAARGEASFMYWAYAVQDELATPKVGDLIAYARPDELTKAQKDAGDKAREPTFEDAKAWFDRVDDDDQYLSHSDLVVTASQTAIEVIGGNVNHTMAKKIVPLDDRGRIADRSKPWFAVLRRQGV